MILNLIVLSTVVNRRRCGFVGRCWFRLLVSHDSDGDEFGIANGINHKHAGVPNNRWFFSTQHQHADWAVLHRLESFPQLPLCYPHFGDNF